MVRKQHCACLDILVVSLLLLGCISSGFAVLNVAIRRPDLVGANQTPFNPK